MPKQPKCTTATPCDLAAGGVGTTAAQVTANGGHVCANHQPPHATFGATLANARTAANVTVAQLATRMACTRQHVWRMEASASLTEASVRRYLAALDLQPVLTLAPC